MGLSKFSSCALFLVLECLSYSRLELQVLRLLCFFPARAQGLSAAGCSPSQGVGEEDDVSVHPGSAEQGAYVRGEVERSEGGEGGRGVPVASQVQGQDAVTLQATPGRNKTPFPAEARTLRSPI